MSAFDAVPKAVAAHREKMVGFKKLREPLTHLRTVKATILRNRNTSSIIMAVCAMTSIVLAYNAISMNNSLVTPNQDQALQLIVMGGFSMLSLMFAAANAGKVLGRQILSSRYTEVEIPKAIHTISLDIQARKQARRMSRHLEHYGYPAQ